MATIKMLDLKASFPNGASIARPRTLAWPVLAYRVMLPDISDSDSSELNPFEKLLLSLLEIDGSVSAEQLAKESCIPADFATNVLLRLQDAGYIDDRNVILKKRGKKHSQARFKPAMVFRELMEGKILPYVLYNTQPEITLTETSWNLWRMLGRDQGYVSITAQEVLEAIKEQKRHERAYGDRSGLPQIGLITVGESNEHYYLECPIGMTSADGEFRIANPFGKGYSLVLERVFLAALKHDEGLESWVMGWRKSLASSHAPAKTDAKREPFDTDRNRRLYPHLVRSLKPSRYGKRSIERLYSSIEWALFYANERYGSRNAINLLKISNPADTPYLQKRAAEALGITIPQNGFMRVYQQNLSNYCDGIPEMPTALAIMLLQAQSDLDHPLRAYAHGAPDFVASLYRMKTERDIKTHGKGRGAQGEQSGQNEAFVKQLVHALLPNINFSESEVVEASKAGQMDALIDARFEARTALLNRFGYAAFNNDLLPLSQERLVDAESFWMGFEEGSDALAFVGDLYAALQSELSRRVEGVSFTTKSDRELIASIESKAHELNVAPLPKALSTVRPHNIRKALQGLDETTLGGVALAFMMSGDSEELNRVLAQDASFFADIGEIVEGRGHLNEPLPCTRKEVDRFREHAYKAIRALMEN